MSRLEEIEALTERIEATDYFDVLRQDQAELVAHTKWLIARVREEEEALAEYADEDNWSYGEWMMPGKPRWDFNTGHGPSLARHALGDATPVPLAKTDRT